MDGSQILGIDSLPSETIETLYSKKTKRGNYTAQLPVRHYKCTKPGLYLHPSANYHVRDAMFLHSHLHYAVVALEQQLSQDLYIELDFQKDNSFDLIPFLFDWDSTLAMFSKKFIKELSYGSITWGVLPFLSDLKSLQGSLSSINDGLLQAYQKILGKPISRRFNKQGFYDDGVFQYHAKSVVTLKGVLGGSVLPDDPGKAFQVLLDEIGLNLDLKVVWDVIPLSFVVDYFLPIGDMLESLHPRGWFNPTFAFDGSISFKMEILQVAYAGDRSGSFEYTSYSRYKTSLDLGSRPPVEPAYQSPSFKGLFNTAYLGLTAKK
jgi:hypothetical protein